MTDTNYWGSTDMVFQCLIDKKRTLAFKNAISNSVESGDIVVDLGSGSGILAMFAIDAGASKVYAVEEDDDVAKVLSMNIQKNGYADKIILLKADAKSVVLPEKVDAVTCEMVATGLIDELQIPVMNNILKFCKSDKKIFPMIIENYVDLVDVDQNFYGHDVEAIQYEYEWDHSDRVKRMSNKVMYKIVDFRQVNENSVNGEFPIVTMENGQVNGLRFSNKTHFPDGSSIEGTAAYCMPMILPIPANNVKKDNELKVKLNYKMCEGMKNLRYEIKLKDPS
jgi:type I protein arginine methyltransferase